MFLASWNLLPPGPQTEHQSGPSCNRCGVPQGPGIRYRLRKGCEGYGDLTDFELACATHSSQARSRNGGTEEGAIMNSRLETD
jgi:hypothetical protein